MDKHILEGIGICGEWLTIKRYSDGYVLQECSNCGFVRKVKEVAR